MRNFLIIIVIAATSLNIIACQPANDTERASFDTQDTQIQSNQDQQQSKSAPTLADLDLEQYQLIDLPESIPNAQSYQINFDYQPQDGLGAFYFDQQGKLSDKTVADGFYRKVLGKTAEGKFVVQDFYQDTQSPLNSVYILKEFNDVKTLKNTSYEGQVAAFDKQGKLLAVSKYLDGTANTVFLIDGYEWRTVGSDDNKVVIISYDHNRKVQSAISRQKMGDGTSSNRFITFYGNGSAMAELLANSDSASSERYTWDEQGQMDNSPQTIAKYQERFDSFGKGMKALSIVNHPTLN